MSIVAFGINHQSATVDIREKLAFSPEMTATALNQLMQHPTIKEAVIVSTCNRTEIYSAATEPQTIKTWLLEYHRLQQLDISPHCYYHEGIHAVKHLMRVASGLDSMVIGEPQILGQIKAAYQQAEAVGSVGHHLKQLFPAVFSTTKHVRSTTNIGRCPVSIAYAVVQLCQQHFASLIDRRILLVGAGTTTELVATHLQSANPQQLLIANRSLERARYLADAFDATPLRIGDIPAQLPQIDIIITATASQLPILGKGLFERLQRTHPQNTFFIVDLAVPRDVEPEVADLPNVQLFNIDQLRHTIHENLNSRHTASQQAEAMIELYAANYLRQLRIHEASDIIRHYREHISTLRDAELSKAVNRLKQGKDPQAVMTNFGRNLIHKIMHRPTLTLRQAASDGQLNALMIAKSLLSDNKTPHE